MSFNSTVICKKCNSECVVEVNEQAVNAHCEKCNDIPVGFDDISFVIDYLSITTQKVMDEDGYEYWSD